MKRIIPVAVILILLVAIVAAYEQHIKQAPAPEASAAPQSVSTVAVAVRPMVDSVAAYGNLVPLRAVDIVPDSPGIIREILFTDGQQVAAGTPLVVLDSSIAQAQLVAARAQAETDLQNLRRTQSLSRQGLDSTFSLEQAQSRASASQADVTINERKLAMLTLRAPFAGKLGSRSVDVGAVVPAGTKIVRLEDASKLRIEFRVPSTVGLQVNQGTPVHIDLPSGGASIDGKLSFIDPAISTDTRSVLLRAVVTDPGTSVRSGMFMRVTLDLSMHEHALVIPIEAVTSGLSGSYVYVVKDGNVAERRDVVLGLTSAESYEVLEGLRTGEQVVTVGQFRLHNGDSVKVVPAARDARGPG